MGLRDIGDTLPPGFRFYPSDEELVCHYLYKKISKQELIRGTLVEIDLHTCEPWMLPDVAKLNSNEWYFFSFRDRKYATGYRRNRATTTGYWKATGKDRPIIDPKRHRVVGMRKTLVFYKSRAPNGVKTSWIMHEFRLENPHLPPKEDWVLCRVFYKSRSSPIENNNRIMIIPQQHIDTPPSCHATSHQNNDSDIGSVVPDPGYALHVLNPIYGDGKMVDAIGSKCEDDYGFLFDLCGSDGFGLDEMGFEDDRGSVFM